MGRPRLVVPPSPTTPAALRSSGPRRSLPPDVLRDATRRLGIMSLLAAVLWTVGTIGYHVATAQRNPAWWSWQSSDAIAVGSIAVSIGLFIYSRGRDRDPQFVLDLGLVYLVITSLALGLVMHWDGRGPIHLVPIVPTISWIGPGDGDVCCRAADLAQENARRGAAVGLDGPARHARRKGTGRLGLRPSQQHHRHALRGLPDRRRRGRRLACGHADSDRKWPGRASWAAISWVIFSAAAGWARSTGRRTNARAAGGDQADSGRRRWAPAIRRPSMPP